MNNDFARTTSTDDDSIINEHGFAAILSEEDDKRTATGIIGAPRVTPTRCGLWIEDGYAAALDTILIAILEDFAIHGNDRNRPDLIGGSVPRNRDGMHWRSRPAQRNARASVLTICTCAEPNTYRCARAEPGRLVSVGDPLAGASDAPMSRSDDNRVTAA